ncbi:MAG: [FeFe] hydrogenase, group A [Coriobacteriales bacterium]|jgi:NADP-reducing hydrogenase subunit HndD
MVNVTIDGKHVQVEEHTSILKAARQAGVQIPTLCYLEGINEIGACRVCVVEIEGCQQLAASCNNEVSEGMVIHTNSPKVREARKTNVQLILSQHNVSCTSCVRGGTCQLQKVSNELGLFEEPYKKNIPHNRNRFDFPLVRFEDKCIKCLRCLQVCEKIQQVNIWDFINHASHTTIGVKGGINLTETNCSLCGQCITHCPVGALRAYDDTDKFFDALADPDKITIVQIAPAVRAAWGETLGLPREKATVKRLVAALRRMGVDYIFDTVFSADLTIMEEGSEFLARMKDRENNKFPMFTSCCPGWIRFVKGHYPEFVDNLSTAKSPMEMFGATAKSYYAKLMGIDPEKIVSIAVMPCVAKKAEAALPTMNDAGAGQDVDIVLTTREVDRMIRSEHMVPEELEEEEFDTPLGVGTGAGVIFGATGGVMEAALRTAYYLAMGENPDADAFKDVRGLDGWKEATFHLGDTPVRVAVASGLGNTRKLLDALKAGEVDYDFVEIMACPGGCSGGGGQPISEGQELAGVRGQVLYGLDKVNNLRFSHENPSIQECYETYFGAPLSEKAERLLHTDHHGWKMPYEMELDAEIDG